MNLVVAMSFSAFTLLPAILLHISLGDRPANLVRTGYLLSAIAVGMHFWEVRGADLPLHQSALLLITIGFLVLTGCRGRHVCDARPPPPVQAERVCSAAMCLALFAASFVHLGPNIRASHGPPNWWCITPESL